MGSTNEKIERVKRKGKDRRDGEMKRVEEKKRRKRRKVMRREKCCGCLF